jgi:2-dehydropantoate 2-reductase
MAGLVEGRIALITGAGGRIGARTAAALAGEGAGVVAVDLSLEAAQSIADRVAAGGGAALALETDVSDPDAVERTIAEAEGALGLPDILVNCAGIFPNRPLLEMDLEEWDRVFAVNVRGTMLLGKALASRWVASGVKGSIVNLSSIAAASARAGASHYAASKAAVSMLTQVMAIELGPHGIRVNAVAPGLIVDRVIERREPGLMEYVNLSLEATPLGRTGSPDDIAEAIVFLASERSAWTSGAILEVTGGAHCGRTQMPFSGGLRWVTVCDRNREHVAAIGASGLKVSGVISLTQRLEAVLPEELEPGLGTVLLAVKTTGTRSALATIAPRLRPDGLVVSLQNGLQEYEIARAVGAGRTLGGFLSFGGHYVAPGEVAYGGPGSLRVGELDGRPSARVERIAELLSIAHPAQPSSNIFGFLWSKTAVLAFYFASALSGADVQDLIGSQAYRPALNALVAEVASVAEAEGVRTEVVDGFDPAAFAARDEARIEASWAAQLSYWNTHESRRTGIWRDLAVHHRETEVGGILLPVLERAHRRRLATPLTERLPALVREVESSERRLGRANLAELGDLLAAR